MQKRKINVLALTKIHLGRVRECKKGRDKYTHIYTYRKREREREKKKEKEIGGVKLRRIKRKKKRERMCEVKT